MSLRLMGAAVTVKPNVPRARASAMSLAATVLDSTTATSVSTICAAAAEAHATARTPAASPTTKRLGSGPPCAARCSEGLANREIDLDPVVVQDLPERIAHVETDRANRRGDPETAADARVEIVEGKVLDRGRDGAGIEEGNAAEPAVDRKAPLEVQNKLEIATERVTAGVEWSDLVELVPANRRAAARLETILDHEGVGAAIGRREAEAGRERQHRRRRPRDEPGVLEPELDEVHVAAERRGAEFERGVVIAPPVRIGGLITQFERQRGDDAGDQVVALLDALLSRLHEDWFDVVAGDMLEAIAGAAAHALGSVRGLVGTEERLQEVALHREGRAQSVADIADLLLPLLEPDRLPLPFRAEDPGLPILKLGAITLLAHPLAQRDAPASPEQVVVADRNEPAKAFFRIVSRSEFEAPRLRFAQRDRDVPVWRVRVALRLDVDSIEEARRVQAAAGLGEIDGGELIAVLERQLAHDDVELGGGESGDQDLADPRDLALLHSVRRLKAVGRLCAGQAHARLPVAAPLIELLDLSARLLGPHGVPGIAGAKPDRLVDQIEGDELGAGDDDVGDFPSRTLDDGNDDSRVRPVVAEGRTRRPHLRRG